METTIIIKQNRTQLVLSPETEHDKEVVAILLKLPNTHKINFYDTRGGWSQFSGCNDDHNDIAIVFDATPPTAGKGD